MPGERINAKPGIPGRTENVSLTMLKYFFTIIAIYPGMFAAAQVPVRYEYRHHNVFENEYVRVLDVYIAPSDTTQFHIHSTPSVFLSFTKTITGSQLMGQSPARSNTSVPGRPSYDSLGIPRIHRVWNEDSTWFHVMDIELTGGKPRSNEPELQSPFLTKVFDRFLANAYNVQLPAGESLQLPVSGIGYLLVSHGAAGINYHINNSTQHRFMKAGHYIWIESGKISSLTADSNTPAAFMLLQLK